MNNGVRLTLKAFTVNPRILATDDHLHGSTNNRFQLSLIPVMANENDFTTRYIHVSLRQHGIQVLPSSGTSVDQVQWFQNL